MPRFFKKPLPVYAEIIEDEEITIVDRDGRRCTGRHGQVIITGPQGEKYTMSPARFIAYFDVDADDPKSIGMMESLRYPRG